MPGIESNEILALVFILICAVLPGLIAAILAHRKGRSSLLWFFLSALFPGFILLVIFLKPAGTVENRWRECPACREFIHWEALVCRHCDFQVSSA